jgi:hypothetical protein
MALIEMMVHAVVKAGAQCPFTKLCWYAFTPVRPDFLYHFRRMYLVLFRKSVLGSVNVPLAVLYLLVVFFSPHCRLLTSASHQLIILGPFDHSCVPTFSE